MGVTGRDDAFSLQKRIVIALESIANISHDGTVATLTDLAEGLDEIKAAIQTAGTKPKLMAMRILGAVGNTLQLSATSLVYPPPDGGTLVTPVLVGIPQILRLLDITMPTAAVAVGPSGNMEVTYGGDPIASGELFIIGPYDLALRTPDEGFAAAAILTNP